MFNEFIQLHQHQLDAKELQEAARREELKRQNNAEKRKRKQK